MIFNGFLVYFFSMKNYNMYKKCNILAVTALKRMGKYQTHRKFQNKLISLMHTLGDLLKAHTL